jgi:regulator of sigma E protease
VEYVTPRPGTEIQLTVKRDQERHKIAIIPRPTEITIVLDQKETVGRIGVAPTYLPSLVGVADPKSPAHVAGLRTFDLVVAVDGIQVTRLVDLEKQLIAKKGAGARLTLKRLKNDAAPPFVPFADQFEAKPKRVSIDIPADATSLLDVGIESASNFVAHVTEGGVAEAVGLRRGDKLVELAGKPSSLGLIIESFNKHPKQTHQLAWIRDGRRFEAPLKQKFVPAGAKGDLGIERDSYDKGFWGWIGTTVPPTTIPNPALVGSAFHYAAKETWGGVRLIGIGFKLLFQGRVSLRSIGGPIMIGQLAGQAGQLGASSFFWIMALISLNLGLINLLPIPVLDGGQIVMVAIESVTKRPISRAIKEKVMLVGVAMLLLLMVFATWNDIARIVLG